MRYPNDEAEDRVIARALDAAESYEDGAAMDRATLDEYRKVLSYLPFEEVAPPVALEDRVVSAALDARPATVRSLAGHAAKRRSTARWITLGAAVAAAAAVITFMFTTSDDSGGFGGQVELASSDYPVAELRAQPGTREAPLIDLGSRRLSRMVGSVALGEDGEGVLYNLRLPETQPGQVIWVWLIADDKLVPIGAIEDPTADTVPFEVTGDSSSVDGVAMSVENSTDEPEAPGPIMVRGLF
jgi:hypothetical protein